MRTISISASVAILFALAACTTTTMGESDGTGGATSGPGGGGSSAESCKANNADGTSSCQGFESCSGGEYCSINMCKTGCLTTANCPNGQFCDMAAPSTDVFVKKQVGICRACPAAAPAGSNEEETTTTTPAAPKTCSDVHGAYTMKPSASSSAGCGDVAGECSVTQDDCTVTISCREAFGSNTVELDSNNKGTIKSSFDVQGQKLNANCAVSFTNAAMTFDCQFSAQGGGGATCKAVGTKK